MRRSRILLLAVLSGLGTLGLMQYARMAQQQVAQEETVAPTTSQVLVFAGDLARGTLVDGSSLRWQEQLISAVPAGAITATRPDARFPDGVTGKLLRRDVLAGEPVNAGVFVDGPAGFMSLTLQPGMRAVGLAVTPQKLAGGFILPDDRVDVIHTVDGDFDGDGRASSYSQTILKNVRVLAVGTTPSGRVTNRTAGEQAEEDGTQSDVTLDGETVTLELGEAEAAVLFSAMASGQISLALRALEDSEPSGIASILGFEQGPGAPTPEPAMAAEPAAPAVAEPAAAQTQEPTPTAAPAPTATAASAAEPEKVTVRLIEGGNERLVEILTGGETR
ncbi:Flp pilus assembly protein CpaB [Rhodobacteraceae bacterium HSP-20]|uniref:Flp pilus assembly protein CpaB n=1 Tax=Paragemmobacter amnigenus TaxID=2852097 RepID=A0ABS6J190_9RHOB|nr:Flp pilus assembly protein CpaB [Rhodobacter amnigenus]MBU9697524.1 Flp pilus assembly protein CpaB [Rhodobacter amnigenus]MBV4388751.1 Flp pilus assembly protein CpaB [Rhodobacter amnigenus]